MAYISDSDSYTSDSEFYDLLLSDSGNDLVSECDSSDNFEFDLSALSTSDTENEVPSIRIKSDSLDSTETVRRRYLTEATKTAAFKVIVDKLSLGFLNEFNNVYKRNNKKGGIKSLRCFPLCKETGHSKSNYCGRGIALISNRVSPALLHKTGAIDMPLQYVPRILPQIPPVLPHSDVLTTHGRKIPETPLDKTQKQYLVLVISKESENHLDRVFKNNLVEHYYNIRKLNSNNCVSDDIGTMIHLNDLVNLHSRRNIISEQSIYVVTGDEATTFGPNICGDEESTDTFRIDPTSWVYGWISGRHSASVNHTVCAYMFHKAHLSSDDIACTNNINSKNIFTCIGKSTSSKFNIWSTKRCRNNPIEADKPLIQPVHPGANIKNNEKDELDKFIGAMNIKTELRKPFKNITCKRRRIVRCALFSNHNNCRNSLRP
jgi:hypothetical protein